MKISKPGIEDLAVLERPSIEAIRSFYNGLRPFWYPVATIDNLKDNGPFAVELLGRPIVLARLDGNITAMLDVCRHFQARLSIGEIDVHQGREVLRCRYHGWAYDDNGHCVHIPQLREGRSIPSDARVTRYQTAERYGLIWVCLEDKTTPTLPEFPEFDDTNFRTLHLQEEEPTRASATRMVMGTIDDTHFPWVHEGILGDRDRPHPPDHKAWREENDLVIQYQTQQPTSEATTDMTQTDASKSEWVDVTYTNYVTMPLTVRLCKDGPAGRYVIWLTASPTRYNLTTNFWAFSRNYDTNQTSDQRFLELAALVRKQDKPIIESQRPWLLPPFWTGVEMPLQPGDLPQMRYQKWLEELGVSIAV